MGDYEVAAQGTQNVRAMLVESVPPLPHLPQVDSLRMHENIEVSTVGFRLML